MRKLSLIIFLILGWGCNKDDPEKFTSIAGYWIIRTPDDATTVTFRIGQDSNGEFIVESAAVRHNGTDYNAQPIDAGIFPISPTQIESITFRTNSFVLRFLEISVNTDFTEMDITNSILLFDGVFREFSMIKATRN
ncbi:MAG: hypothetical protein WD824_08355 [Cyclobacteriaceae bacterium]